MLFEAKPCYDIFSNKSKTKYTYIPQWWQTFRLTRKYFLSLNWDLTMDTWKVCDSCREGGAVADPKPCLLLLRRSSDEGGERKRGTDSADVKPPALTLRKTDRPRALSISSSPSSSSSSSSLYSIFLFFSLNVNIYVWHIVHMHVHTVSIEHILFLHILDTL